MSLKKSLIELKKNEKLSIKREVKKELTQIKKQRSATKKTSYLENWLSAF